MAQEWSHHVKRRTWVMESVRPLGEVLKESRQVDLSNRRGKFDRVTERRTDLDHDAVPRDGLGEFLVLKRAPFSFCGLNLLRVLGLSNTSSASAFAWTKSAQRQEVYV